MLKKTSSNDFQVETRISFKDLNKRFDDLDQRLFEWKSELFSKIDTSYIKPIKDLQDESGAQGLRLEAHQRDIDKLKVAVYSS